MNTFTTWLTVLMLVLFSVMVIIATSYPPGARMMPLVVGIPGILLCVFQLVLDWLNAHHAKITEHFHSAPRAGEEQSAEIVAEIPGAAQELEAQAEEPEWGPETVRDEVRIWAYFLLYISGVILFGFLPSIPVLVTVYLWREAKVRFIFALLAGLACVTLLHVLFESVLRFELYQGYIGGQILRAAGL